MNKHLPIGDRKNLGPTIAAMTNSPNTETRRLSLSTYILLGLLVGLLWGLFFGEYASSIKWIGDAYVGLLQMTVLPYVAISLIVNIGRLSAGQGYRLFQIGVGLILALWLIGLITLALMTTAFPTWATGSFFSSRFTEVPPEANWLDLFIPSNPFRSLSDNAVPAVVVFSIGIGVALMNVPNKQVMLDPLDVAVNALSRLNKMVVRLTPLGMFGIVGYTAGTLDLEQFKLIQGYLLTYGAAAIVLTFCVLPCLIAAITPFSIGEVGRTARGPLVAAFVIGNSFVVLPMMIDAVNRLFSEQALNLKNDGNDADFLVPLAYPFPDLGRIVGLIFIPFAAWFYGSTIESDLYPQLIGVGLLSAFGKPVITVPLLLELAELPGDIFNLFLASGVIAARFGDLMKTMHLMTFAILATCYFNGLIRFHWRRVLIGVAASVLLMILATTSIRFYLDRNFKDDYAREKLITEREMVFPVDRQVAEIQATILERSEPNPDPIAAGQSRIQRILQHGKIRIGFDPNKLPFCYYTADHPAKLVGFDVQMAYYLADDLHVGIEFVPIEYGRLNEQLQNDHFDVAMSAMEGTIEQAAMLPAIEPYMETTLAIVVPDYEASNFRSRENILNIDDLKLAAIRGSYFAERAPKVLPENVQIVELASAAEFFENRDPSIQGLVISAESGSAWTIRQPKFTVANPLQGRIHVPLYYLTANDQEFETFLQNWLTLKRSDGTFDQMYEYWILGVDIRSQQPRWSILRNLLGWVD